MFKRLIPLTTILLCMMAQPTMAAFFGSDKTEQSSADLGNADSYKCQELKPEETTNIEMVNKILEDKKPYAALAFIDSFKTDSPQLELLKAHSLRKIGKQAEAEAIYSKLTQTCMAAYAYQGLGLISNLRNKPSDSVKYLKMATKLLPINTNIRNDYGFALMQVGDYPSSLNEFLTAIELDDRNTRAKYNLLALLYKNNQKEKADQFAKRYNITDAESQKPPQQPASKSVENKTQDNGLAAKSGKVCTSDSDMCTGIFSMKLESYAYE